MPVYLDPIDGVALRAAANGVGGLSSSSVPSGSVSSKSHSADIRGLWSPTTGIVGYRRIGAAGPMKFERAGRRSTPHAR